VSFEDILDCFIKKSLADNQLNKEVTFKVSARTIQKAYKLKFIDLTGYKFVIRSREIRHIYKEHGKDVYLIKDLPMLLEKFYFIDRSNVTDEKTGKPIKSIIFKKRTNKNDIKIVKTNMTKSNILRLKTLFEMV